MNEVFDAKVTIHETLHTLTSIKALLGQSVNKRRRTMFCSTVFGKWLDFLEYSNDNLLLNYIFQHEIKQVQNNDVCPLIRYKIGNNHFEFGRQEFCLITGFAFGKIPNTDTFHGLQNSPFCNRVFPDKISKPLKKVRVLELLGLLKSPKKWYALFDEDSVKFCLLLVSNIIFMGQESKNYIADNLTELVDDLTAWDAYPRGEYFWRALYRSWSKIGKFKKGDYGALFAEWSNPILCMAPMSIEFNQQIICDAYVHDPQFVKQSKQVVELVPVYTKLVAITQGMNAIERFIKSRSDNMSEDSVAKQSVEKEIESSGGKRPESSISDVLNGELSFDKNTHNIYHGESSKNEALSEEIDPKEYDKNVYESGDGKVSESEIINVLTGEVSCDKYVGGFYDESQVNEYASFNFDNTENDSLSDMVKTGEEDIQLDGLEIVDDPLVLDQGVELLQLQSNKEELALLCGRMFPEEFDKIEKYIRGLPDMIQGSIVASKPKTMQEAVAITTELMDRKIRTFIERQIENKRKQDDNNYQAHQQPLKKQGVSIAYTARPGERKESPAATNNHRNPICYQCGNPGHYISDCPELGNQDHGNQARGTGAHVMVHALEGGETNQDLNDVEDDINA
uniref:Phospholipase-like protein n=1 Tax=Tanacetum cinerariifolium TaxID=118510 RepID=A0A6L2M7H9_TANCI|nr:phospholipase-like protein [Tanacetum cinerariifolium]